MVFTKGLNPRTGQVAASAGGPSQAGGKLGEPRVKKNKSAARGSKSAPATYERYIYKILKNVHPKMRISKQAMSIMNSQVNDTFERISTEALKLSRLSKSQTLTTRDVVSACRLVLPGELSKHAVAEGSRCYMKYKTLTNEKLGKTAGSSSKEKEKTDKTGADSPLEKEASAE